MIEYRCNKGNVRIKVEGDTSEIGADILTLIHIIHADICSKNLFAGLELEALLTNAMSHVFQPSKDDADMIKAINSTLEVREVQNDEE